MLDGFSKALSAPDIRSIRELVQPDAQGEYAVTDRERTVIAGIVTAVTRKTTKKDEQMAFFTLEDRYGEIECLAFPQIFARFSHLLRQDAVLRVSGNISVREEESPKLLVSELEELQDDHAPPRVMPESEARGTAPRREVPTRAEVSQQAVPAAPRILYLRVPSLADAKWRRAKVILDIFDGNLPVSVYDTSKKAYEKQEIGFDLSPFTLNELVAILGKENVVLK